MVTYAVLNLRKVNIQPSDGFEQVSVIPLQKVFQVK